MNQDQTHLVVTSANRASTLRKEGHVDEAMALIRSLLDHVHLTDRNKAYLLVNMAYCHYYSDRYGEALRDFLEALQLDRINVHAHVGAGNCYARTGSPENARSYFQQALRLDPSNNFAQRGMDNIDNPRRVKPSAYATVSTPAAAPAIIQKPSLKDSHATALRAGRDPVAALQTRIAANSRDVGAHYQLACIFVQKGMIDEASIQLWDVLEIDRKHHDATVLLRKINKPLQRPSQSEPLEKLTTLPELRASVISLHVADPAPVVPIKPIPESLEEFDVDITIGGVKRTICQLHVEVPAGMNIHSSDWQNAIKVTILSHCPQTQLYNQAPALERPANMPALTPKVG